MYYVLFHYSIGKKEKDFLVFRSEQEVIEFLHAKYKKIDVYRIIEAETSYRLGLTVTEDLIKSTLNPMRPRKTKEEEEKEILQQNKVALERADKALEAGKKDLKDVKENWQTCPKCGVNKIAPWNKKGICSTCQKSSAGKRKYKKRKPFLS